jgi:hypothetical protein
VRPSPVRRDVVRFYQLSFNECATYFWSPRAGTDTFSDSLIAECNSRSVISPEPVRTCANEMAYRRLHFAMNTRSTLRWGSIGALDVTTMVWFLCIFQVRVSS